MTSFLGAFDTKTRIKSEKDKDAKKNAKSKSKDSGSKTDSGDSKKKASPNLGTTHIFAVPCVMMVFYLSYSNMVAYSDNLYHDYYDYSIPITGRREFILVSHIVPFILVSILACRKLNAGIRGIQIIAAPPPPSSS